MVIQDKLPKGIVPLSGGIKLTQVDGSEINCPDSVYSSQSGDVTVFVGPVRGGQSITLTVNAMVTDEALGTDIGNVAFAYGTDPSDTDSSVLEGNPSAHPARATMQSTNLRRPLTREPATAPNRRSPTLKTTMEKCALHPTMKLRRN